MILYKHFQSETVGFKAMFLNSKKFQIVPRFFSLIFGLFFLFNSQEILAAQLALVTKDRAVVYADTWMTSPIGYLSKGKKILISDNSKNKGSVYALIVAGKVAYVSTADISTEVESVGNKNLNAERYKLQTDQHVFSSYSLLGNLYPSVINIENSNGGIKSGDMLTWSGFSLKGSSETKFSYHLEFVLNYLTAKNSNELFKMTELGVGLSWKLLKTKKLNTRFYSHGFFIPYSSYEIENKFRKNSFGLGGGLGINSSYLITKNIGLEIFAGLYFTRLNTITPPLPYSKISPWFYGARAGLGLNYNY